MKVYDAINVIIVGSDYKKSVWCKLLETGQNLVIFKMIFSRCWVDVAMSLDGVGTGQNLT